ncbi:MAG: DUF2726 domain-containing protein [Arenicellales bacterium]
MRSWFSKPAHQDSTDLPLYKRRDRFLRESDRQLFDCLRQVLGRAYHVFAKVKLSALVEPQVESSNRVHQLHWIKVHRQTIDFLICRSHDLEPLVAIRLFPKTEYARRGLSPQDVTDTVLRDIGLPSLTLTEKKSYEPEDLKKKLRIAMAESQHHGSASNEGGAPPRGSTPN